MIIKKFSGINIYGNLNFEIDFFEDINFLIGINGSGKTTILNLILGLLIPSPQILSSIFFKEIILECFNDEEQITIRAKRDEESRDIELSLNNNENLKFPITTDFSNDEQKRIEKEYLNHPVIQKIHKIVTPIYLGLDRRIHGQEIIDQDEMMYMHRVRRRRIGLEKHLQTSLDYSVVEIQELVYLYFRKIKALQEPHSYKLRQDIILSAFEYEPYNFKDKISFTIAKDKKKLEERKEKILKTANNLSLGLNIEELKNKINKFFSKIEEISNISIDNNTKSKSDKKSKIDNPPKEFVEWVVNRPQIERIENLLKQMEDYQKKIETIYEPINNFMESLNLFFQDSNKTIEIDSGGEFKIKANNKSINIHSLSSGEKQILVILSHLVFNENLRGGIFIIDEPELSLHLKWQEAFVKSIIRLSPNIQFILATHSPSIVLDMKSKVIKVESIK